MISNARVQDLIATDRETLIALIAIAVSSGSFGGKGTWDVYLDPDIKDLLDAARTLNARPAPLTPAKGSKGWIYLRKR